MKTLSIVSLKATKETANDRRLAIQNAWSIQEMTQRHQDAIESQFRLAGLILMAAQKKRQVKKVLEFAS